MNLMQELKERGLVGDLAHAEALATPRAFYHGIDPTADAIHLGHLVGVVAMCRLQRAGFTPVALIGGATGLIGDPSGKAHERPLLDDSQVAANVEGIGAILRRLLGDVKMVNNLDWFGQFDLVTFLRDVGKNFRMGKMLGKEMVRTRLASDEGMSFTEFSYQVLQAYDFLHLFDEHKVELQIGGSDQWGNITAGTELVRKLRSTTVYGYTYPLLTRADGKKFGKTEEGTVWCCPKKTSPYDFYQYLLRVPDSDVIKLMKILTFLEMSEIDEWEKREPGEAQKRLAEVVTEWVHGSDGLGTALQVTQSMAPGSHEAALDAATLEAVAGDMPGAELSDVEGMSLVDLLVAVKLVVSKGEGRRLIRQGGVSLNNRKVSDEEHIVGADELIEGRLLLIGVGKKKKLLLRISS